MSTGPIEFASDEPVDDKGPTEYGGRAGLIQGGRGVGEEHPLTPAEQRGLIVRAEAPRIIDPITGLYKVDDGANAVDPVTGLEVDPEWNLEGASVPPVDAPPRTGDPMAGEL